MKKILFTLAVIGVVLLSQSCDEGGGVVAEFEDMERQTIYDYIVENPNEYSKFLRILEAGGLDKTVSAYNPNGDNYTMFLPHNEAIDLFIEESERFSSLDELLNDKAYVQAMSRYHVVNREYMTYDFPFGALADLNLAGQTVTIGFEMMGDSSVYKINNIAPVVEGNIEVSNGYIHVISKALEPITLTTAQWLESKAGYSIFNEAVKQTGFYEILNKEVVRDSAGVIPNTLLVEHDSIYNRQGIYSIDDLIEKLNVENNNYTEEDNALYKFVGYHIINEGEIYLSEFEGVTRNYNTYGEYPININGEDELDIAINLNKNDTIFTEAGDTIVKRYRTFFYDNSNIFTLTGAIHQVDYILWSKKAGTADKYFTFYEEPLINMYKEEVGEYMIQDQSLLTNLSWEQGISEIIFIQEEEVEEPDWREPSDQNYLIIEGDFSITYKLPKIVQGEYDFRIKAHALSDQNAVIEVFLDGQKIGGTVDLTKGGTNDYPFNTFTIAESFVFSTYTEHEVTIKSLIPGRFEWDEVQFIKPGN
jgi:uncharacterized surface protein with fasciclin (FAS1) repeats/uncharacterized protein YbcI